MNRNLHKTFAVNGLKALLLAGLSLFGGVSQAASAGGDAAPAATASVTDAAPSRRVIKPTPVVFPTPEVGKQDIEDLRATTEARLKQFEDSSRLQQKGHKEDLVTLMKGAADAQQALNRLELRVAGLEKKQTEALKSLDEQSRQMVKLAADLEAAALKMAEAVKQTKDLNTELDEKGERLASLADLLGVMRRDLNDSSREIVEVKDSLLEIRKALKTDKQEPQWWDQVLRWPYLPAVAVGLAAIAIGVAASR